MHTDTQLSVQPVRGENTYPAQTVFSCASVLKEGYGIEFFTLFSHF